MTNQKPYFLQYLFHEYTGNTDDNQDYHCNKTKMQKKMTASGTAIRFRQDLNILRKSLTSRLQTGLNSTYGIELCREVSPSQPQALVSGYGEKMKDDKERFVSAANIFEINDTNPVEEVKKAYPLPYTREELEILLLGSEDGVTNEIRACILWHAIEREQLCKSAEGQKPPSSNSILMLLLSPIVSKVDESEENNHFDLFDDDAVIVHTIDVVLSHYATNARKINPFESWSGAWDKSIGVGKNLNGSNVNSIKSSWRTYYSSEILGSNKHHAKMTKGHKITACLLKWAKHMQLNNRYRWGANNDNMSSIYDQDSSPLQLPKYIEFVSEVMRLFVARWVEAGLKTKRGKKRKENNSSNINRKLSGKKSPKVKKKR